jgi:hypothetical protein
LTKLMRFTDAVLFLSEESMTADEADAVATFHGAMDYMSSKYFKGKNPFFDDGKQSIYDSDQWYGSVGHACGQLSDVVNRYSSSYDYWYLHVQLLDKCCGSKNIACGGSDDVSSIIPSMIQAISDEYSFVNLSDWNNLSNQYNQIEGEVNALNDFLQAWQNGWATSESYVSFSIGPTYRFDEGGGKVTTTYLFSWVLYLSFYTDTDKMTYHDVFDNTKEGKLNWKCVQYILKTANIEDTVSAIKKGLGDLEGGASWSMVLPQ